MDVQGVIERKKEKITELQNSYEDSLSDFCTGKKNFRIVHKTGLAFFSYIEDCCASINSSEELKNSGWSQWLAETCLDVLPLILKHFIIYRIVESNTTLAPSDRAYAGMQRLAKNLDKKVSDEIRLEYVNHNLPIYGFENKDKMKMVKNKDKYLGFVFGLVFVVIILITTFTTPNPTSYQYSVYRIVLSLAAGGVGAVLPGVLEVKFKGWLRASGAAAFFIIVYFYNPVALLSNQQEAPKNNVSISSDNNK